MKVREVMIAPVVTVSPKTSYEETAALLHKHKISGMPVVDDAGNLIGIVSEKDLFRAMFPSYENYAREPYVYHDPELQEDEIEEIRAQPIEKYMNRRVVTIDADACILSAGGLMLGRGLHRLPVVENKKLIGIITRRDIYGTIFKKHLGF